MPKGRGFVKVNQNCFLGIFADVCGDYAAPVI